MIERTRWSEESVRRLCAVYAQGGRRAAIAEFPTHTRTAVISAIQHYVDVKRPNGDPWTEADVAKLRAAHAKGSARAAHAAFPDRSRFSVAHAIRSYCICRPVASAPPVTISRDEVTARIAAIPHEQFFERVSSLLLLCCDYGAAT